MATRSISTSAMSWLIGKIKSVTTALSSETTRAKAAESANATAISALTSKFKTAGDRIEIDSCYVGATITGSTKSLRFSVPIPPVIGATGCTLDTSAGNSTITARVQGTTVLSGVGLNTFSNVTARLSPGFITLDLTSSTEIGTVNNTCAACVVWFYVTLT